MKSRSHLSIIAIGIVAVGALSSVTALDFRATEHTINHMRWVAHTEEVIGASGHLLGTLLDAETGQRGYIITGDTRFLKPFNSAAQQREQRIVELRRLTRDNSNQQIRILRLDSIARKRQEFQENTIRLRASGRSAEAIAMVSSGRGQLLTDQLRAITGDIVAEEQALLRLRSAAVERDVLRARLLNLLIGILSTALLVGATAWMWRDTTRRLSAEHAATMANQQLSEANERLNEFVGVAAHDLRNPLTAVQGYSDILLHRGNEISTQNRTLITKIRNSAAFMLRMVDNLLDVSRIQSGQLRLNRHAVDVAALVSSNVEMNREIAAHKGIDIGLVVAEPLTPVELDQDLFEQVLNNLISNAVKFSPPGTKTTVMVQQVGGELTVSVRDEGPGIPPAELSRLFKPFSRTTVQATAGEKSTGLGLMIAHRIITAHGGDIRVESTPGQGCNFIVTLPTGDTSEIDPQHPRERPVTLGGFPSALRGEG